MLIISCALSFTSCVYLWLWMVEFQCTCKVKVCSVFLFKKNLNLLALFSNSRVTKNKKEKKIRLLNTVLRFLKSVITSWIHILLQDLVLAVMWKQIFKKKRLYPYTGIQCLLATFTCNRFLYLLPKITKQAMIYASVLNYVKKQKCIISWIEELKACIVQNSIFGCTLQSFGLKNE